MCECKIQELENKRGTEKRQEKQEQGPRIGLKPRASRNRVGEKATFLKKANFSRLKWIKPDNILGFFKRRVFSKMRSICYMYM